MVSFLFLVNKIGRNKRRFGGHKIGSDKINIGNSYFRGFRNILIIFSSQFGLLLLVKYFRYNVVPFPFIFFCSKMILMHNPVSFFTFSSILWKHIKNHNLFAAFLNSVQEDRFSFSSLVPADISKLFTTYSSPLSTSSTISFHCSMEKV